MQPERCKIRSLLMYDFSNMLPTDILLSKVKKDVGTSATASSWLVSET
jgi:hypothetical protein